MAISAILLVLLQCLRINGNEVLQFQLTTPAQVAEINELGDENSLDFWQFPSTAAPTHVYTDAGSKAVLVEKLRHLGIPFDVFIPDVDELLKEEWSSNVHARRKKRSVDRSGDSVVGYFAQYEEVMNWLDKISKMVDIASVFSIGNSYENRELRILKLSTGTENRTAFFFNAGLHAREWLTVAAVNYVIQKLIDGYNNKDPEVMSILDRMDIYILPIANPDGYEYTFINPKKAQFRLWRKTRQPWGKCIGTDANRNFDYHFGGRSTSNNTCSVVYRGPKPFSENETVALRNFMWSFGRRLKAYVDVHCCAQMFLMPWSFTTELPSDYKEIDRVANHASKAMSTISGMKFPVGSPAYILYAASGTAYDWAKGVAHAPYSYCIELWSHKDRKKRGFVVPVENIKPAGEEIYQGMTTVAKQILFPTSSSSVGTPCGMLIVVLFMLRFL